MVVRFVRNELALLSGFLVSSPHLSMADNFHQISQLHYEYPQ